MIQQDLMMKKETFKQQIQAIKDAKKKTITERIDTRISSSNAKLTAKMQNAIYRLTAFVDQISTKEAQLAAGGTNTASLKTAIANAKTAIATAQTAINTQKAKTYEGQITDETTLGSVISQLVRQFNQDIQATHRQVLSAKTAVLAAMQELVKLKPETTGPTATPTL